MKIAVIGAGAMGSIYGGHLSLQNEVWLVDTNQETVEHIQKNGLILQEEARTSPTILLLLPLQKAFPLWIW